MKRIFKLFIAAIALFAPLAHAAHWRFVRKALTTSVYIDTETVKLHQSACSAQNSEPCDYATVWVKALESDGAYIAVQIDINRQNRCTLELSYVSYDKVGNAVPDNPSLPAGCIPIELDSPENEIYHILFDGTPRVATDDVSKQEIVDGKRRWGWITKSKTSKGKDFDYYLDVASIRWKSRDDVVFWTKEVEKESGDYFLYQFEMQISTKRFRVLSGFAYMEGQKQAGDLHQSWQPIAAGSMLEHFYVSFSEHKPTTK